jgi:hypothetical protein
VKCPIKSDEATTSEISKEKRPESFAANKVIARQGGEVAGNARKDIESKTGKSVISAQTAQQLGRTTHLNLNDENQPE